MFLLYSGPTFTKVFGSESTRESLRHPTQTLKPSNSEQPTHAQTTQNQHQVQNLYYLERRFLL